MTHDLMGWEGALTPEGDSAGPQVPLISLHQDHYPKPLF